MEVYLNGDARSTCARSHDYSNCILPITRSGELIEFKSQDRMNPIAYTETSMIQFDHAVDTSPWMLDVTDVLVTIEDARKMGHVLRDLEDAEVFIARSCDFRQTAELAAARAVRDLGLGARPLIRYFESNRKRAFSFVGLADRVNNEIWIEVADRPLAKMAGTVIHEVGHLAGYDEATARAYGDVWAEHLGGNDDDAT
jgi:hypothetical protein